MSEATEPASSSDSASVRPRRGRVATSAPSPLRIESVPDLRRPILVCAFAGWNDAAQTATGAVRYLIERYSAIRFAQIDPEEFYVFTETRPTIRLVGGVQRELDWPANDFFYWRVPRVAHDLVLLAGVEPQTQWRAYTSAVLELGRSVNAGMIVMLGGLLADVAYTAPVKFTGGSSGSGLLPRWERLGIRTSRYEGPTGIVGVLSDACRQAGLPTASIWANVPHYINASPNPKTLAGLVHQLDDLLDLDLDLYDLDEAAERFERQVTEAVSQNPEVRQYIRQLEETADDEPEEPAPELPSGAAIVAELEEFLRQRREDEEEDEDDE
jgi:proteasome assembly chaperone (PAC2) family protein